MGRTRISIAKPDILAALDAAGRRVLKRRELEQILEHHRSAWQLPASVTSTKFLEYLLANAPLRKVELKFPHRPETLFVWREASLLKIAASIKPGGYLSHYTALHLHELTDQVPKTIYVNHEQRPQPAPIDPPNQARIDAAFRRPQRQTKNIAIWKGMRICLINGKATGRLGVIQGATPQGETYDYTNLERTLIDATVRPAYAGGVGEVLRAYRRAQPKVSINKLMATLRKLDYLYPYEQAIGFYLERAGVYRESQIELVCERPFEFDFYVAHGMKETEYSPKWRLHYPKGL